MSSFLGSAVPGTAPVCLARSVAVSVATTASTTLFTTTARTVITGVVVTCGATAFGSTTSFKIMGAAVLAVPTTVATSLPAAQGQYVAPTSGSTTAIPVIASGTAINFNTVQIDGGTATAATVDLFGYVL